MKIKEENISKNDKKRNIIVPTNLTPELAELTGIMAGDGNIYSKNNRYEICVVGDAIKDYDYHKEHIRNLFEKSFNIIPITKIRKFKDGRQCIVTKIESKSIVSFMINEIGLPKGKKTNISIPKIIREANNDIISKFIRGIADTDFTIHFKNRKNKKGKINYYPLIVGNFSSKALVEGLKELLMKINLHSHIEKRIKTNEENNKKYSSYAVVITGKKNLLEWMNNIGFANKRHYIKFLVWKKIGYCPPNMEIIKGEEILKRAQGGN
ncbi:MAG: LAGLIDADG family homing endonuclease [Nanoarchaeota archaeon]